MDSSLYHQIQAANDVLQTVSKICVLCVCIYCQHLNHAASHTKYNTVRNLVWVAIRIKMCHREYS